MKCIKVEDAIGSILCHDVTQIIKGEFKGRLFKKGHIITEADIEKFLDIGKENIYVWEETEGELHENDGALRVANLVMGSYVKRSFEIKEGKIDFYAEEDGILKVNLHELNKINSIGEIIVSTIHNNTQVKKGEKIASTRVIPLVIKEEKIIKAENEIIHRIIQVNKFEIKNVLLITTGNEIYKGRIKDAFFDVIQEKLNYFGSSIKRQAILPDDAIKITTEVKKGIEENFDLIICTGGMSVDPDDVTNTAIKESGAEIIVYGAPVLPGAMFLLAYHKEIPILGIPSCAMYSKRTILDLVLPRILSNEKLSKEDIQNYGHGGLCLDCIECRFPHCSFGK